MKSSVFGGKRMIEEINYKVQNGDKDYTNSTSLSATNGNSNNLFFSMITMQVLYSMFISVLLYDKYSKDRATGARIYLSH